MQSFDLIILAAATFYVAYCVSSTDGPLDVFKRVRVYLPLGGLTKCIICLSVWIAALLWSIMQTPLSSIVYILAISGTSVLLFRYTGGSHID